MVASDNVSSHDLQFRGLPVKEDNYITFGLKEPTEPPISTGGFGNVSIQQRTDNSSLVAVKRPRYSQDKRENEIMDRALMKDITPLLLCKNNYILQYIGLTREEHPGIVCEYAKNGSLDFYLRGKAPPTAARVQVLREVAAGLAYLHQPSPEIIYDDKSISIVHGDLHPGNVLIMGDGKAVLADFGLCKISEDGGLVSRTKGATRNGHDGLVAYLAPEMYPPVTHVASQVTQKPEYDRLRTVKADVFAYGILVFTTLGGRLIPTLGPISASVTMSIIEGTRPQRVDVPGGVDDNLWSIMGNCWKGDASTRPTMGDVSARIGSPV